MFSVSWIVGKTLRSIATPNEATANSVAAAMRWAGFKVRTWYSAPRAMPIMLT